MSFFNNDFKDFLIALNQNNVEYIVVGGYAVILRGYSRSTGDLDIWVHKTNSNFILLQKALRRFGLPLEAVPQEQFFSENFDVFSFGVPPNAIEVMTAVKGIEFAVAFNAATMEQVDDISIRVIHLKNLLEAKKAAGRSKDVNDIENLPLLD